GFGKWAYADHDTHLYWDVKFGKFKLNVHRLGRAYTYIDLKGTGIDPLAFKTDPSVSVALALRPGAHKHIKAFIPLSNYFGVLDTPLSRKNDAPYQKAYEFWQDFRAVIKKLPTLLSDIAQSALSVKR
ncbi:MAG TPA: hypothetical protein PLO51_03590, partial [Candidatus Micrarchaeota archaeon]|nr:hypothetical protein [Candidatus Micrarchaeota archaeon]